ncbi:hypothetical protein ACKWTF_015411 [Chironomus riparius]
MKCDDDNESITINTLILFSFILSHKLPCYYRMYLSSTTKQSRKDKRNDERDMRKAGFEYKLTFHCEDPPILPYSLCVCVLGKSTNILQLKSSLKLHQSCRLDDGVSEVDDENK